MNIFAAIKKAINSDLDKPLNITLDEIQSVINRKPSYKVFETLGIPYNATNNTQVLSEADAPVFSVEGAGRILQIVPVTNNSGSSKYGTVLLTVDGNTVINNKVNYGSSGSDYPGQFIADTFLESGNRSIYTDLFTAGGSIFLSRTASGRGNVETYSDKATGIFNPTGIPFNNGFELRLTQSMSTTVNKTGVIVVYELYE